MACASSGSLPQAQLPTTTQAHVQPCDESTGKCCAEPDQVSECALFRGLYDLEQLTQLPQPEYTSHMRSSFDVRSREAAPDTPDWFANRDFLVLSSEREHVLFDEQGPGVLTRIWSANPSGRVRVYLDEQATPAIDAELSELLQGRVGFAFNVAEGSNLYLPIAFQRRCRIILEGAQKRLYYQINFRRYAQSVRVPAFRWDGVNAARAAQALTALTTTFSVEPTWQKHEGALRSGEAGLHLPAADGGSVLRTLRVLPASADANALRETALSIWVDGERTVHVPLGDFFGAGPGLAEVRALPVWTEPEGPRFSSRWPMPFQRELRVALTRERGTALTAQVELWSEPRPFDARTFVFHAVSMSTGTLPNEPTRDYNLTRIQGDGVYVGTRLNVTNAEAAWWGEGDEKIWLDDDTFPSFFGTGTEDYFGYAYCSNARFTTPYVGQPLAGSKQNYGRVALYRFHIADPIRFHNTLRFDQEVNHWGSSGAPVAHDGIAYFYARPGARAQTTNVTPWSTPDLAPEPNDIPERLYQCGP